MLGTGRISVTTPSAVDMAGNLGVFTILYGLGMVREYIAFITRV